MGSGPDARWAPSPRWWGDDAITPRGSWWGLGTHTCRAGSPGWGLVEVRGAWSQSPGFRSNSANVLGSLALSNKMLTEAAVLTPACCVPSPALRKHRANIPQALLTIWGIKEGCFSDERAEAQRGKVIYLRSHTAKSQNQDLSSVPSDSRTSSPSLVLPRQSGSQFVGLPNGYSAGCPACLEGQQKRFQWP